MVDYYTINLVQDIAEMIVCTKLLEIQSASRCGPWTFIVLNLQDNCIKSLPLTC